MMELFNIGLSTWNGGTHQQSIQHWKVSKQAKQIMENKL